MVKPAPAVARAALVLEFFTAQAGRPCSLSEVADALGVRPGTLLTILQALTERGFLARHARLKTYVLGPAVIAAGHAALLPHPIVHVARDEVRRTARASGLECAATLVIGDRMMLVASAGRSTSTDPMLIWTGAHLPLQHPFGAVFVAWSDAATIAQWIGAEYPGHSAEHAERLDRMLAQARLRGYTLGFAGGPQTGALGRVVDQARARTDSQADQLVHSALHPVGSMIDSTDTGAGRAEVEAGIQRLSERVVELNLGERPLAEATSVAVPVFGATGEVVLAITGHGFEESLNESRLSRVVDQLAGCATHITKGEARRRPSLT